MLSILSYLETVGKGSLTLHSLGQLLYPLREGLRPRTLPSSLPRGKKLTQPSLGLSPFVIIALLVYLSEYSFVSACSGCSMGVHGQAIVLPVLCREGQGLSIAAGEGWSQVRCPASTSRRHLLARGAEAYSGSRSCSVSPLCK